MAEGRAQPTLILEDDACLQRHIPPLEACLERLPPDWDFLTLGYNTDAVVTLMLPSGMPVSLVFSEQIKTQPGYFQRFSQDATLSSHPSLFQVYQFWGNLAYIVSPKGARRLLNACFPLRSVDLGLHLQTHSIKTYSTDGLINVGLRDGSLRGFALFPPIVLGPNAADDSDVVLFSPGAARRVGVDSRRSF
jgi:GR25 family glycosyltransferase involved in LPS biosynthesis